MADVFGGGSRGKGEKALEPADFDGEVLVGTIAEKPRKITTGEGRRRWVVRFVEYPKQPYYCGIQQLTGIVKVLGRDDDQYIGKHVALYAKHDVENPTTGGMVSKFYPMEPDDWKQAVEEYIAAQQPADPEPGPKTGGGRKRAR